MDGDEFVIAAVAGEGVSGARGARVPIAGSIAAHAWRTGRSQRFAELPPDTVRGARDGRRRRRWSRRCCSATGPSASWSCSTACGDDAAFGEDDERLLQAFAASAATAVATAQIGERRGAAAQHRGLRGRARPLGARAARRDAPATRRPARAAVRRAPQRRPGADRRRRWPTRSALIGDEHRRPARADHRPAAGGARRARARPRRCETLVARVRAAVGAGDRARDERRVRARRRSPARRDRVDRSTGSCRRR